MLISGTLLTSILTAQNVVVFVLDDISDRDLDALYTPAIDAVAAEGLRFRRAYSMPLCSASRYCMLFGKWRIKGTGAACDATEDFTQEESLADVFRSEGYSTACFGKWHAGSATPWPSVAQKTGFDTWRAGMPGNVRNCGGSSYTDWVRVDDGVVTRETEYQTRALRDAFLEWWPQTPGPRFAWVALQAPHGPFHRPPASMLPPNWPPTPSSRLRWEAMAASADKAIGEMLAAVDLSDTVVVILADNGSPSSLAPFPAKGSVFEGGVRVPMVWYVPNMSETGETHALIHVSDIKGIMESLLGRSDHARLGRDWLYVGRDGRGSPIKAVNRWGSVYERAIIESRWKLREVDGVEELYDLETDPEESSPLPPQGENYERLRRIMEQMGD